MKNFAKVLILLMLITSSLTALKKTGSVGEILPIGKYVYFKLNNESTNCLINGNYFYIVMDEENSSINLHTTSFYYFPLMLDSRKSATSITIDIGSSPYCGTSTNIPVNYMYVNY